LAVSRIRHSLIGKHFSEVLHDQWLLSCLWLWWIEPAPEVRVPHDMLAIRRIGAIIGLGIAGSPFVAQLAARADIV
jgi:hypothetical protein